MVSKMRMYGWLFAAGVLAALATVRADESPAGAITAPPSTQPASTQPAKSKEEQKDENAARGLEFIRINQPYAYDQARTLQKSDPATFDRQVAKAINNVKHLEDLQKRNK